jgi:hypothetical protein
MKNKVALEREVYVCQDYIGLDDRMIVELEGIWNKVFLT